MGWVGLGGNGGGGVGGEWGGGQEGSGSIKKRLRGPSLVIRDGRPRQVEVRWLNGYLLGKRDTKRVLGRDFRRVADKCTIRDRGRGITVNQATCC